MKRFRAVVCGLALAFIAHHAAAQATAVNEKESSQPLTLSIATTGNGQVRYGIITLARGQWQAQNINWVDPSGSDALSALLFGKSLRSRHSWHATVLAGPWYSYSSHRWDEAVLNTSLEFHGERLRAAFDSYWGIPTKASGYYFSSHSQTFSGIAHLPPWLGASFLEKHESDGFHHLWAGPRFVCNFNSGHMTVSAYPYWDFTRHTADLRLSASYKLSLR